LLFTTTSIGGFRANEVGPTGAFAPDQRERIIGSHLLILGIDTATPVAAVGVVEDDGRVLADVFEHSETGHAARLPILVERALETAGRALRAIDALAVSIGPGSFTGLRVGLSFAKGIAFASGASLVGVGTLEALAATAADRAALIAVVLDARRGETYTALFRSSAQGLERVTADESLTPEQAAQRIAARAREASSTLLVGNGAERYAEHFAPLREHRVTIAPFGEIHPRASVVARLAAYRLARGENDRLESIVPRYVRPSAAEKNLHDATLTTENSMS
jgi:tRNA threonylcarbamoyladenosine biosynthesis protein TsaB